MSLRIVSLYPDLLGTYGDGGNAMILSNRARWRGVEVELIFALSSEPVPKGDLYCLGGGEDGPQEHAATLLKDDGGLVASYNDGAGILAVCAGFQIVGNSFEVKGKGKVEGLGILNATSKKGNGQRAVGEVLARFQTDDHSIPILSGFENHSGATKLATGVRPLGTVISGVGNGAAENGALAEGARATRIVATYLHGPILARNPALCDFMLSWFLTPSQLFDLDDSEEVELRANRISLGKKSVAKARFMRKHAKRRS